MRVVFLLVPLIRAVTVVQKPHLIQVLILEETEAMGLDLAADLALVVVELVAGTNILILQNKE
jgi:hypothetical protein